MHKENTWIGWCTFCWESKAVSQLDGVNLMSDRVIAAKYAACVFNLDCSCSFRLHLFDERSIWPHPCCFPLLFVRHKNAKAVDGHRPSKWFWAKHCSNTGSEAVGFGCNICILWYFSDCWYLPYTWVLLYTPAVTCFRHPPNHHCLRMSSSNSMTMKYFKLQPFVLWWVFGYL